MKKVSELEWLKKYMVFLWGIASILFALIIHCLFSETAPNEWIAAKWGAGDILIYASTVALGLLAIWQNKKFKEENDLSQARLEKLITQANELSVISNIIEHETANYEELRKAIHSFEKALDFYHTMTELRQKGETTTGREIVFITESHRIRLAAQELWDVIDDDIHLSDKDKHAIEKPLDEVVEAADKVIEALHNELTNPEDHSFAGSLTDFEAVFKTYKEAITEHQIKVKIKYEQLVYGNLPLEEIKKMYGYPIKEEQTNG